MNKKVVLPWGFRPRIGEQSGNKTLKHRLNPGIRTEETPKRINKIAYRQLATERGGECSKHPWRSNDPNLFNKTSPIVLEQRLQLSTQVQIELLAEKADHMLKYIGMPLFCGHLPEGTHEFRLVAVVKFRTRNW